MISVCLFAVVARANCRESSGVLNSCEGLCLQELTATVVRSIIFMMLSYVSTRIIVVMVVGSVLKFVAVFLNYLN